MLDFKDKCVIVTAAGAGIGRSSATLFAQYGAAVVVNDIDPATAQQTAADITAAGGTATACPGDVSQREFVDALVATACETFGRLDVMFNNAGGAFPQPMLELDEAEYRRLMALNLDATYFGTQAALPVMLAQGKGCILSTTSGAGLSAMPGLAVYGMAKAGVISLMRSVATEYGRQGIRAVSISPGAMETPGLVSWLKTLPGGVKGYNDAQPQGRLGTPEEIASAAVFLASDGASFINGAVIPVDGAVHSTLWNPL
jgi:3-oxoacyl-[acyl-carrier protein] reductase